MLKKTSAFFLSAKGRKDSMLKQMSFSFVCIFVCWFFLALAEA